jgi:DNA-binding phage protein
MMQALDPSALAGAMNSAGEWMKAFLREVDPSVLAGSMDEMVGLLERVLDSISPETLISLVNRLAANGVLQQVAIDTAVEVPMRHKYMLAPVQLVGARRMNPTRRIDSNHNSARVLPNV